MTENRFGVITNWCVYEKIDGVEKWLTFDETVTILNQLNDENEQLKKDRDYLNNLEKSYKDYYGKPITKAEWFGYIKRCYE